MGYISAIRDRRAEITAQIAGLVAERDDLDAAERALLRLGFSDSAVPTKDNPRPMEGAADSGEVSTDLAASNIAPVAMGEADAVDLMASADLSQIGDDGSLAEPDAADQRAGEVGPETVGASPAQSSMSDEGQTTGKPAGSEGSAAPTLADRLRKLNAAHPEFTVQQVARELGETFERVRNNSNAHKIRWSSEPVRSIGLQDRVAELHMQHRDWTDADIAAAIGKSNGYVRATAQRLGLVLPSRKRPAPVAETPVQASPEPEAPEAAPEPESPPAIAPEPANDIAPAVHHARPSGRQFWLINGAGEYLNRYCQGFTRDRREAWTGNAMQLVACRRKFEIARDLSDKPVEKDLPVNVNREVA